MRYAAIGTAAAALCLVVGGCTSSKGHEPSPGAVSGFAVPCVGVALAAHLQLRVTASEKGRTVASVMAKYQKDRGHHKLVLTPGRYVISAAGSGDPQRSVILHSSEHIIINFPDRCK